MSQKQFTPPPATPLARALDQNDTVKENMEQSAAELLLINTVLKHEIPDPVQTGDVARALQRTGELESRIQESAEELAWVHQVLAQEIAERAALERELAAAKLALTRSRGEYSGPRNIET